MPDDVRFDVRHETPSLDHYRREWLPAPDAGQAGMWLGSVVGDRAGQDYWGLRGADDFVAGMTHVVSPVGGFRKLVKRLDADPLHLFAEYSGIDWYEPFEYSDDGDSIQLLYSSGRFARDGQGCHWYDASGRFEMHGKTVSDIFVVHVPRQDGIPDDVYYRHELMFLTGTVDGVEVSGYGHQDYAYGTPGKAYTELPIARSLQGMWVSWLHEYSDGELGGGCFWQGRGGLDFGPGYQFKGDTTTVHDDVVATPTLSEANKVVALKVSMGSDSYSFTFDTNGSPLHVFGNLVSSSSGKQPARSWCWVEYEGGMMTPELLDLVLQRFELARSGGFTR